MAQDHRPSATEVFRSVQGGVLCRGVYLSPGLDVVLKERERVVDVKDDLQYPVEFKDVRLTPEVTHHELTSKKSLELFVSNADKHIDSKVCKVGGNVYGISTAAGSPAPRTHGFLSSIHCHMYATRTLHILHRDIKLQPSAVRSLQEIEESIQKCNYQLSNHFQDFFETFGSYVNHGVIRIGGLLMSIVHCNDIPEEDFSRMAEAVKAVSSEALKQGPLPQKDSNGPGNANDVMGEVSGVSVEDLKKITVEFKSVGGPVQPANLEDWVDQLQQNSDLWQVISRKSTPKPIWTLLEHHQDEFKNVGSLADAMQKEWGITLTKMSSQKHKETEEAAESKTESLTEWDIVTGEHIPSKAPDDEREEPDPDGQHSWDTTMEPESQIKVDSGESISNRELEEDLQDKSFEVISDEAEAEAEAVGSANPVEIPGEHISSELHSDMPLETGRVQAVELERDDTDIDCQGNMDATMEPELETKIEVTSKESAESEAQLVQDFIVEVTSDGETKREECETEVEAEGVNAERSPNPAKSVEEKAISANEFKSSGSDERRLDTEQVKLFKQDRDTVRRDIDVWLKQYNKIDQQNTEASLHDLLGIKERYGGKGRMWEDEVMCLREVQRRLLQVTDVLLGTTGEKEKMKTVEAMEQILDDSDKIDAARFPKLGFVKRIMATMKLKYNEQKIRCTDFKHLMNLLKDKVGQLSSEEATEDSSRELQTRLEATVKAQSLSTGHVDKMYDYVLFVSVLQCFCFNMVAFLFQHALSASDFQNLYKMLEAHMTNFSMLKERKPKQAYILSVALSCNAERHSVVKYALEKIPEKLQTELSAVSPRNENISRTTRFEGLETVLHHTLRDIQFSFDIDKLSALAIVCNMKSQLALLDLARSMRSREFAAETTSPHDSVCKYLEALGMKQYYPQKLRYEDVIKLTSDVDDDVNRTPTLLPELPWYFMKHIIGLDSDTRETCSSSAEDDVEDVEDDIENVDNDVEDVDIDVEDVEDDVKDVDDAVEDVDDDVENDEKNCDEYEVKINTVHTLDLVYIIFLCADDFLRQELAAKMNKCQYAVPFILPPSGEDSHEVVLKWGLKSIIRDFSTGKEYLESALIDLEAPLVTFIGKEASWKSKILNEMLSPNQETFWHQRLPGGDRTQRISQGMVEVAWYLPGGRKGDKFPYPVTFANVRENSQSLTVACKELLKSSTVTCFFVEEVDEELNSMLDDRSLTDSVVVVILNRRKDTHVKKAISQFKKKFPKNRADQQVIQISDEECNFNSVQTKVRTLIKTIIKRRKKRLSLSDFAAEVGAKTGCELDDTRSYHGRMAAESILKDVDKSINRGQGTTKVELLPMQSDFEIRRTIANLDKELIRQKNRGKNVRIKNYKQQKEEEKLRLHKNQLRNPVSETYKSFLHYLLTFDRLDRKYFLQWLKFGLNKRSSEVLQPLYQKHEELRAEKEEEKMKKVEEQLAHESLAIEHFFREVAVLLENLNALSGEEKSELGNIFVNLSRAVAELFTEGMALEIFDGDAVSSPVAWLSKVFNNIDKSTKVFKVSTIGAQSCGKSTLLNTVFGLNFPVSSGRCTRGANMQLVKVDDELKKTLNCDYVAVIDSEGLMSRTKASNLEYDNELATFVIGLSDLTLVNIKGEGNEMSNVLQTTIQVFLRMNIVGEDQACHFVHQNTGAVDARSKVLPDFEFFLRDLNASTFIAAEDNEYTDKYKRFTDILDYNPTTDNTLVPELWNGAQPMAKTSSEYAQILLKLKSNILNTISKNTKKRMCSFVELRERLCVLWGAIKSENFVFSFKNIYQYQAHQALTNIFNLKQRAVKEEIRSLMKPEETYIGQKDEPLDFLVAESRNRLKYALELRLPRLEEEIQHYFKCKLGCDVCSPTVEYRYLLAPFQKEFESDVHALGWELDKEITSFLDEQRKKVLIDKWIRERSNKYDEILKRKVQEIITETPKSLTEPEMERKFQSWWEKETSHILENLPPEPVITEESIKVKVQQIILTNRLKKKDYEYRRKKLKKSDKMKTFTLKSKHFKHVDTHDAAECDQLAKGNGIKTTSSKPKKIKLDFSNCKAECDNLVHDASNRFGAHQHPYGKKFNAKDVEAFFDEMLLKIEALQEKFQTNYKFKIGLLCAIEKQAVDGLKKMHEKYCNESSPEAMIEQKKTSYLDLFMNKMGQGNHALKLCNTPIRNIIFKIIRDCLNPDKLLADLRAQRSDVLHDVKSIQKSVVDDLLQKDKFESYLEYIIHSDIVVKAKLKEISVTHFRDKLKNMAKSEMNDAVQKIRTIVEKVSGIYFDGTLINQTRLSMSSCKGNFVRDFFDSVEKQLGLELTELNVAAYLDFDVPDINHFTDMVLEQLDGPLRDSIAKTIDSWDVSQKLEDMNFIEIIYKDIFGCKEKCPFCLAPCDAHSGEKKKGKHSTMHHRPLGLIGQYDTTTNQLITEDCTYNLALNSTVRYDDEVTKSFRKLRSDFPDWNIKRDVNPDVDKIWKWVLNKHNDDFAKYYKAKRADIPPEWTTYDIDVIRENVNEGVTLLGLVQTVKNFVVTLFSRRKETGRKPTKMQNIGLYDSQEDQGSASGGFPDDSSIFACGVYGYGMI